MPLPQVPAGNGGRRPRVHWHYPTTPTNSKWHGWIAGNCHWFECHTKGKSQPCTEVMTGGELRCPRCDACQPTEVIGYQPIYREIDNRPCFVILHEYTREVVDALKLHQRVIVCRGPEQSDGCAIVPALNPEPRFQTKLQERLQPADLTETLLRVWRIPELVQWYDETHGCAPIAPPEPHRAAPAPVKTTVSTEFKGKRFVVSDVPLGEEFEVLTQSIYEKVKARENGNGKPKPK
jgi:hypothetical protein